MRTGTGRRQQSQARGGDDRLEPPLKWAGGKRWQIPELKPLWAAHSGRRLVEPFCGGLAVVLGLQPERALLNDINPHLVNFYRWLRRGLIIDVRVDLINDAAVFYRQRQRFNDLLGAGLAGTREAASLFYYLNRTGYNGLCRFNARGEFNVPFGSYRRINYRRDFSGYRALLGAWTITCGDFERVRLDRHDLVYADPPYDVPFTHYSRERFAWPDQVRLAKWLAGHSGPAVLVNQATDRIMTLYEELGYECRLLHAPRRISCTGDRTPVREVLATRNM